MFSKLKFYRFLMLFILIGVFIWHVQETKAHTTECWWVGADSFGYTCKYSDQVGGPTYSWIDASSGGTDITSSLSDLDDGNTDAQDIGFTVDFYGNSYTQVYVGSNGLLTFGAGFAGANGTLIFPNAEAPNNFVAPFGDDLDLSDYTFSPAVGAIYTKQLSGPNRFVVEWQGVRLFGEDNRLTFEAIIYENGDILFQYQSLTGTVTSATVGIENSDGSIGSWFVINEVVLEDSMAIQFYYPADTTAPAGPTNVASASHTTSTYSSDNTIDVSWTAATDAGGLSGYSYIFDTATGTTPDTTQDIGTVTTTTSSALADGNTWYFHIIAVDTSSNWGSAVHLGPFYIDTASPTVSSVSASSTNAGATITWTTNEDSSSKIDYGLTSSYNSSTTETDTSPRVTSHSVSLSSLVACTTYHYRVRSKDAAGNEQIDSDNTFTTTGCVGSATVTSQTSSSITTALGGSVSLLSSGTGLALTVPASFAGSDAVFQIKQIDKTSVINTASTPSGFSAVASYIYDLKSLSGVGTSISSFSNALTVTMSYAESDTSSIDESSLTIYRYDGSWSHLSNCNVNIYSNIVTCQATEFSVFALFAQPGIVYSGGGSYKPIEAYNLPTAPAGGFSLSINNGAKETSSRKVVLSLKGGSNTAYISFSEKPDFPEGYQASYISQGEEASLLPLTLSDGAGKKTVYVKFCNPWGLCSNAVSNDISLNSAGQIASLSFQFKKPLMFGLSNADVRNLQTSLKTDPAVYPEGLITGYFGTLTMRAVQKFQAKYALASSGNPAFGYVGPKTRAKLNELYGK